MALELAMRYPDIATAYIAGGVCRKLSQEAVGALNAMGFLAPGSIDLQKMEESVPAFMAKAKELHSAQGKEYWRDLLLAISFLWMTPFEYTEREFAKIITPVLFLIGDRDQFNPLEQVIEMYRFTPNSELAIVPNADHSLSLDVARFTDIVLDFLFRHPPVGSQ
jgi:pimeloyl-ACP methyl ester carboxylesterase